MPVQRPITPGLRRSALATVVVLWALVVALVVLAVTSAEHRGGIIGMAILWGSLALGATAVTVAVERRLRGSDPGA